MTGDGRAFRAKRMELGLSYGELARFLGVTEKTIRNWEAGQGRGDRDFLEGRFDLELRPLLELLPRASALAFLPTELKSRLLALRPLLLSFNPELMNQLNTLQKETLEGLFSGEYTVSKEVNDVY